MPAIDLHVHTNFSDGTFTPRESIELASQRGVEVVAITDHDTTDVLEEAFVAGAEEGVKVVPGVEFSTVYNGAGVHILCYYMHVDKLGLVTELRWLRYDRLI